MDNQRIGTLDSGNYGLLVNRVRLKEVWEALNTDFLDHEVVKGDREGELKIVAFNEKLRIYLGYCYENCDKEVNCFRLFNLGKLELGRIPKSLSEEDQSLVQNFINKIEEKSFKQRCLEKAETFKKLAGELPLPSPTDNDVGDLLFWSFRYALGRRTAAVTQVANRLIKYKRFLNDNDRTLILKEISESIESDRAGDDCDVVEWKRVRSELENER